MNENHEHVSGDTQKIRAGAKRSRRIEMLLSLVLFGAGCQQGSETPATTTAPTPSTNTPVNAAGTSAPAPITPASPSPSLVTGAAGVAAPVASPGKTAQLPAAGSPAPTPALGAAGGVAIAAGAPAVAVPTAGTGAAADGTSWPADCEERYKFVAHGQATAKDSTKYSVPGSSQYYASFMFQAPWGTKDVHGLKFHSIIDNPKVVHHWIIYGVDNATVQDGALQGGPGQLLPSTLPNEAFIQGWAPGGEDGVMPDGVGLHMPSGTNAAFRLEIHYNNTGGAEVDASGVEMCVTSKKRPQEAAVHWLGTANFSVPAHTKKDVVSTCRPNVTSGPVHVLSVSPHMHKIGASAKVIINRANGGTETLIDLPFDFTDQRAHKVPMDGSAQDVLINPGDTLTSTCGFNNTTGAPIAFGENTEDEMCFFFTLAWPRGQLSNGQFSIIPGAEPTVNCLQ